MNKSDLAKFLSTDYDLPLRKTEEIVDVVFDTMSSALAQGARVEIRGFGSFKVKDYKGYVGRNPKTGKTVKVKPKKLPIFKAGKELKEQVDSDSTN